MRRPVPRQPTPLITRLGPLSKRCRNTPIELRDIHIIQKLRIPQTRLDQLGILDEQILTRPTHAGILAAQRGHENRWLAVVVELVVDRALRPDGALV